MTKYAPDTKPVAPEVAAAGLVKVLNEATIDVSGSFFNYDGTKIAW